MILKKIYCVITAPHCTILMIQIVTWRPFYEWFFHLYGVIMLTNFAHVTAAQLLCHVQNFISIIHGNLNESRMKFPLHMNYDGKIVHEMGPWSDHCVHVRATWFGLWICKLFMKMGAGVPWNGCRIHSTSNFVIRNSNSLGINILLFQNYDWVITEKSYKCCCWSSVMVYKKLQTIVDFFMRFALCVGNQWCYGPQGINRYGVDCVTDCM